VHDALRGSLYGIYENGEGGYNSIDVGFGNGGSGSVTNTRYTFGPFSSPYCYDLEGYTEDFVVTHSNTTEVITYLGNNGAYAISVVPEPST
jgi:hypothetical protein